MEVGLIQINVKIVIDFGGKQANEIWSPNQQVCIKDLLCARHIGMRDAVVNKTNSGSLSSRSKDGRETNKKYVMISVVHIYNGKNGAEGENVSSSAGDTCGNISQRMCHRAVIQRKRGRESVKIWGTAIETEEPRAGNELDVLKEQQIGRGWWEAGGQ